MKYQYLPKIQLLSLVTIFLLLLSCNQDQTQPANNTFNYTIEGKVASHDGTVLALIPEDKTYEERITAVIKDGTFKFEGTSKYIQPADIRFESEIVGLKGDYAICLILLEPGSTKLEVEIQEEDEYTSFSRPRFKEGDVNKELVDFRNKYQVAVDGGTMNFGDSIRNDSMIRLVYPKSRKRIYNFFDQQFESGTPSIVSMFFRLGVLDNLHNRGLFDNNNLSLADIKKVNSLFYKVDSTAMSPAKYELMNILVLRLNDTDGTNRFVDFTALDSEDVEQTMSSLIKQKKYTLMYFWFTECSPCRAFNQGMKDNYPLLRSKGIEMVGVNVDNTKAKWLNSTAHDEIQWTNLFVGDKSGLEQKYGIRGYPFKLLFDDEGILVDENLKTVTDVMNWVEEIQ
jgi:thioredoxin-related protein